MELQCKKAQLRVTKSASIRKTNDQSEVIYHNTHQLLLPISVKLKRSLQSGQSVAASRGRAGYAGQALRPRPACAPNRGYPGLGPQWAQGRSRPPTANPSGQPAGHYPEYARAPRHLESKFGLGNGARGSAAPLGRSLRGDVAALA